MDSEHPSEYYVVLTGAIDGPLVQRTVACFGAALARSAQTVHLLIHSNGGLINDGIFLHNFLSSLPIELITYNGGSVASAAVPVFLAGRSRIASATALFMIHRVATFPAPGVSTDALIGCVESATRDNARLESILQEGMALPDEAWAEYAKRDFHITPAEALRCGLIQSIGDFRPPLGAQITQI